MKKLRGLIVGIVFAMAVGSAGFSFAAPPSDVSGLTGTWVNVNPTTSGVVKIIVTNDLSGFKIHTFGACSPTPCDHGAIAASPFSKTISSNSGVGLSGQYNFGFSTMLVTAQRTFQFDGKNFLEVETRTKFAAGDTRVDYTRTELFSK